MFMAGPVSADSVTEWLYQLSWCQQS